MLKNIIFLLLILSSLSYGMINDRFNYLNSNDKKEISRQILKIEKDGNLKYYVNLGKGEDESKISKRSIILNIIPDGKNKVYVKLKFTHDIDTEDYNDEIDTMLKQGNQYISNKNYKQYILNVLSLSDNIINNLKKDKEEVKKKETKKTFIKNKFAGLIILIFVIIATFMTLRFIKLKGIKRS